MAESAKFISSWNKKVCRGLGGLPRTRRTAAEQICSAADLIGSAADWRNLHQGIESKKSARVCYRENPRESTATFAEVRLPRNYSANAPIWARGFKSITWKLFPISYSIVPSLQNSDVKYLDLFIKPNIDTLYSSHNHHIVTPSHSYRRINYINAVANWYLGNSFQSKKEPNIFAFLGTLKICLLGEKPSLVNSLANCDPRWQNSVILWS